MTKNRWYLSWGPPKIVLSCFLLVLIGDKFIMTKIEDNKNKYFRELHHSRGHRQLLDSLLNHGCTWIFLKNFFVPFSHSHAHICLGIPVVGETSSLTDSCVLKVVVGRKASPANTFVVSWTLKIDVVHWCCVPHRKKNWDTLRNL